MQGIVCQHVNSGLEQFFQCYFKACQINQTFFSPELHKQIDVTALREPAGYNRTEK